MKSYKNIKKQLLKDREIKKFYEKNEIVYVLFFVVKGINAKIHLD